MVGRNQRQGLRFAAAGVNERKALTNEQIERLIAAATRKAPRMALIIEWLAYSLRHSWFTNRDVLSRFHDYSPAGEGVTA